jgi:glycerol-3-phosphate O-acyltransferase
LAAAATSEVSQEHLYKLLTEVNKDTFAHPHNLGQTVFAWVWNDYYATSAVQVAAAIRKAKEAV